MNRTREEERDRKVAPIAMYVVAKHMLDHSLPAPYSIDRPRPCDPEKGVVVAVPSDAVTEWLDAMVVDEEIVKPSKASGYEHVHYVGRVPAAVGDVAVVVRAVRAVGRPDLQVVPA